MLCPLRHLVGWMVCLFRSREDLVLENLALREQLLALHTKRPRRRLSSMHKQFWIILRKVWPSWKKPLVLVTPKTVVSWHRAGFRLYWKWLSRSRQVCGRKPVSQELRALIFRMAAENPTWGAPRIHGELLKLGFALSEPTVSRWLRRTPKNPDVGKRWLTFLRNHREAIAAMDFFTVPTITFGVLYCFFIISHDRRKIVRFNVTRHPSAPWIVQQIREAWPYWSGREDLNLRPPGPETKEISQSVDFSIHVSGASTVQTHVIPARRSQSFSYGCPGVGAPHQGLNRNKSTRIDSVARCRAKKIPLKLVKPVSFFHGYPAS